MSEGQELAQARLKVQQDIEKVGKDAKNSHFRSGYATLGAVLETVRPACNKHGVLLEISPGSVDGEMVTCTIALEHAETGQHRHWVSTFPLVKRDPQGVLATVTYMSRAALVSIFALPVVDDDGETAVGRAPQQAATINNTQATAILKLVDETDSDLTKLLGAYRINKLGDMPADRFTHVISLLEKKKQRVPAE